MYDGWLVGLRLRGVEDRTLLAATGMLTPPIVAFSTALFSEISKILMPEVFIPDHHVKGALCILALESYRGTF